MTKPLLTGARAARLGVFVSLSLVVGCVGGDGTSGSGGRCVPKSSAAGAATAQDLPGLPGLPGSSSGSSSGGSGTPGVSANGITEVTAFGANPASLKMYVHAPASGAATAIVVAMHGCTQNARQYVGAGWNELADKAGLAIVYPEQTSANDYQTCFRWWDPGHTKRGQGEAKSIASMVDWAKKKFATERAFVTGLSAGGAMTAVMLAAYPDVFEAGSVMSGLPYGCATSQNDAYSCMSPGKEKTPSDWAALLPADAKGAGAPRVSIWHGDADYTVRPANAEALVRQWTAANGVGATASESATVGAATHDVYRDASGKPRVERWMIKGMGHGTVVDPKNGCGTAGAYILDKGVCSTQKTAAFFGLVDDTGTPTVPPPGSGSGSSGSSGSLGSSGSSGADGDCD